MYKISIVRSTHLFNSLSTVTIPQFFEYHTVPQCMYIVYILYIFMNLFGWYLCMYNTLLYNYTLYTICKLFRIRGLHSFIRYYQLLHKTKFETIFTWCRMWASGKNAFAEYWFDHKCRSELDSGRLIHYFASSYHILHCVPHGTYSTCGYFSRRFSCKIRHQCHICFAQNRHS